jgi:hypothetical protein
VPRYSAAANAATPRTRSEPTPGVTNKQAPYVRDLAEVPPHPQRVESEAHCQNHSTRRSYLREVPNNAYADAVLQVQGIQVHSINEVHYHLFSDPHNYMEVIGWWEIEAFHGYVVIIGKQRTSAGLKLDTTGQQAGLIVVTLHKHTRVPADEAIHATTGASYTSYTSSLGSQKIPSLCFEGAPSRF